MAVILTVGSAFRLYGLKISPPSVNWDEGAFGYNAWSLWKTGRDEYGSPLPLTFRSFDDYKPAVYGYLTAPITGLAGLDEFSTRLTSAVAGILNIILIFWLGSKVSKKTRVGLLAAGLTAIEPWAVFYSRAAWEANLSLTFFLITAAAIYSKKNNLALAFAILNAFTYHSAKIYFGLLVLYLMYQSRKRAKNIVIILIISTVVGIIGVKSGGTARYTSAGIGKVLTETKSPYKWAEELFPRYLANFSPANLFVRGTNEGGQKIPGFSVFYVWEFFPWTIGLVWLLKNWREQKFLGAWILAAAIPAMLSWNWFNPLHVLPLWAAGSLLISIGIIRVWNVFKLLVVAGGGWAAINVVWLVAAVFWQLPYFNYGHWQWGFREATKQISPNLDNYDKIVWETPHAQPYIFALFYMRYPPAKYQEHARNIPKPRQGFDFDKYEFRKIYWPDDQNLKNTLFVGGVYSLPEEKAAAHIIDPQGYEAYRIVVNE